MFYFLKERRIVDQLVATARQIEIDPETVCVIRLPTWLWDWFDLDLALQGIAAPEYIRYIATKFGASLFEFFEMTIAINVWANLRGLKSEFWRPANDNPDLLPADPYSGRERLFVSTRAAAASMTAQQRTREVVHHCLGRSFSPDALDGMFPDLSQTWRSTVTKNIRLSVPTITTN